MRLVLPARWKVPSRHTPVRFGNLSAPHSISARPARAKRERTSLHVSLVGRGSRSYDAQDILDQWGVHCLRALEELIGAVFCTISTVRQRMLFPTRS